MSKLDDHFSSFAKKVSSITGRSYTFLTMVFVILAWAVSGPFFHYSNNWQLIINTGTTIITFLMVFLIQNTQNRDSRALHLKLDELISVSKKAKDKYISSEELSDVDLENLQKKMRKQSKSGK